MCRRRDQMGFYQSGLTVSLTADTFKWSHFISVTYISVKILHFYNIIPTHSHIQLKTDFLFIGPTLVSLITSGAQPDQLNGSERLPRTKAFTDMEQMNYEMFIPARPISSALWVAMDALHYSDSKCQRRNRTRVLSCARSFSSTEKWFTFHRLWKVFKAKACAFHMFMNILIHEDSWNVMLHLVSTEWTLENVCHCDCVVVF